MRDRPILFSAPMVRAILAGTKTQTRRVVKLWQFAEPINKGPFMPADLGCLPDFTYYRRTCPYGQPGDRLWVREAWRAPAEFNSVKPSDLRAPCDGFLGTPVIHEATRHESVQFGKLRPSMFMPRWASRINLEITGVRVERLQDISEADAQAEGVTPKWEPGCSGRLMEALGGFSFRPAASAYADLWEQINGPESWAANPWVWVVEFKPLEAPC